MNKEETIEKLVDKAEQSLEAARTLFSNEYYDFATSRAYYAMFYCAEALLFTKNLSFSKHSAVISFFGKEFVKTGIFSEKLHKSLRNAFKDRLEGDYTVTSTITREKCEETLRNAEEFIKAPKKFLEQNKA